MSILLKLSAPRLILCTAWFLVLLGGGVWMKYYRKPTPQQSATQIIPGNACLSAKSKETLPHVLSTREFAVNHRILSMDLNPSGRGVQGMKPDEFLGKYLACPIRGNEPVVLQDLADTPAIRVGTGKSEYPLPLTAHLKFDPSLDVGSQIDLFEDTKRLLQKVPILAIQCTGAGNDDCAVILEVSGSDGELLSRSDASKLRIVRLRP